MFGLSLLALLTSSALAQDACDEVDCTGMEPYLCELVIAQCREDLPDAAAPTPEPAFPGSVSPSLDDGPPEPPSPDVVPWEDDQGQIHIPEGPYGPIESLQEQSGSFFDQPGPLEIEVPPDWTQDADTVYIPVPEVPEPTPIEPAPAPEASDPVPADPPPSDE